MKKLITVFLVAFSAFGYAQKTKSTSSNTPNEEAAIQGTWKLMSAEMIAAADTTYTDYSKDFAGIKIINDTHFSFFQHDLNKGKDSTAKFSSGGGRYVLQGNTYIEFLEYCSARKWESNKFSFTVTVRNDTLLQTGVERVASLGVDRVLTETYVRTTNRNTPNPILADYQEEDVAWFKTKGKSQIKGVAKFKSKSGDIGFGEAFRVELMPNCDYTTERLNKIYRNKNSGHVHVEDGVPKFIPDPEGYHDTLKTMCKTDGSFEFNNLPPGDYYIIAFMLWDKTGGGLMQHIKLSDNELKVIEMTNF